MPRSKLLFGLAGSLILLSVVAGWIAIGQLASATQRGIARTEVALASARALAADTAESASELQRVIGLVGDGLGSTGDALVATLRPEILITIVSTVGTIMGTGFIVGRWVSLYPIEAAIVNACHSGQGGTGDVAILTAANRMELMPFAQIATRIGGAITVTIAISAVAWFI